MRTLANRWCCNMHNVQEIAIRRCPGQWRQVFLEAQQSLQGSEAFQLRQEGLRFFTLRGRCYSWAAGYLYECWIIECGNTFNLDCAIHQFPFYKPLTCLWPLTSLSHLHNISIPSPTCQLSQHRFNLATLTASSLPSRMVSSKVSIAGSSVSSCSWLAPSSYSWSCHDHGFQAPAIPDHPQSIPIPSHDAFSCIFIW